MEEGTLDPNSSEIIIQETTGTVSPGTEQKLATIFTSDNTLFERLYRAEIEAGTVELLANRLTPQQLSERAYNRTKEAMGKDHRVEGVLNKYGFAEKLQKVFELVKRGQQWALLIADSNGLKEVNDRFGHGVGDALIIENLKYLHEGLRPTDTVACIGGDEFALLIPITQEIKNGRQTTIEEALLASGRKVQKLLSDSAKDVPGFSGTYTTSVGISLLLPSDTTHLAGFLRTDRAQYISKEQSKKGPARTNQLTVALNHSESNQITYRNIA